MTRIRLSYYWELHDEVKALSYYWELHDEVKALSYYWELHDKVKALSYYWELYNQISGIESQRGRDFPPVQTGPGAHPVSCKTGTGSFPGVKCGRGVLLSTHPLLVPQSWKSRAITLPTLWATPGL